MYATNIKAELMESLQPLMAELGVYHTFYGEGIHERMAFWRPGEGEWKSPVEIMLKDQSESGLGDLDWRDLEVGLEWVTRHDVGTNGWFYYAAYFPRAGEVPGGREEVLERVEELLRTEPFHPMGSGVPNIPDSGPLLALWNELQYTLADDTEVDVGRDDDGNETISFVYGDRRFAVTFFEDRRAGIELWIDDEFCDRADYGGPMVADMFRRHLDLGRLRPW